MMSIETVKTTANGRRRRRPEAPGLPLIEQKLIFANQIAELARQTGRKTPGNGTLQKLTSRAAREAGRGPKVAGFIGKRPVYEPLPTVEWLDSLVTAEPRSTWLTDISTPATAAPAPKPPPITAAAPAPIAAVEASPAT
jgi:hypothetical protein